MEAILLKPPNIKWYIEDDCNLIVHLCELDGKLFPVAMTQTWGQRPCQMGWCAIVYFTRHSIHSTYVTGKQYRTYYWHRTAVWGNIARYPMGDCNKVYQIIEAHGCLRLAFVLPIYIVIS